MIRAAIAPNLSVCLNRSKTYSQGTGLGARILGANQHGAAGTPAPLFPSCGSSPKSLMNKGALSQAPSCLWLMLLHFCYYYRAQQEERASKTLAFFLKHLPCEAGPKLSLSQGRGSSQPPSQEVLQVGQAQLREVLPACPTPGLGSALGRQSAVKASTSKFGFISSFPLL